jgi:hypothetical protein
LESPLYLEANFGAFILLTWCKNDKSRNTTGTPDAVADFEITFAKQVIAAVQSKLNFFKHGDDLFDCLKLTRAYARTHSH